MATSKLIAAREAKPCPLETAQRVAMVAKPLTGGRRLLVASNRGPMEHTFADDGSVIQREGSGGVAITLSAIARYTPVTWVAAARTDAERVAACTSSANGWQCHHLRLRLVTSEQSTYNAHYNLICNPILWFLQHGQWGLLEKDRSMAKISEGWENGYLPVNRAFADHVLEELTANDNCPVVMFQDYHLYVAPRHVRFGAPQAILSHFVHIPWPPPDTWLQLPWQMTMSILDGLLACDLVGFQTPESAHNFLLTCHSFLQGAGIDFDGRSVALDGHKTYVRAYPISVDVASLRKRMELPSIRLRKRTLAASPCRYTIVAVARLDPAKNILAGFQAFDLLLETNPQLVGQVRFLAFLVPSRQAVPEYRSYAETVLDAIRDINQRWGSADWQPIELFYEHNYEQALAGLALYDVLLVNSLADGMNLVCKEGALVNERGGVLVLSRATGAFRELGHGALPIDPGNVIGTAEALAAALSMPAGERRQRAAALRTAVEANDFSRWFECQLTDLQKIAVEQGWTMGQTLARSVSGRKSLPVPAAV